MVELIKVTSCDDTHRWYADYIGMTFVRLRDFMSPSGTSEWKVRTLDGHSNFIQCCDGEIVESLPLVGDLQIDAPDQVVSAPDMREIRHATSAYLALVSRTLNVKYDTVANHYPVILQNLVNLEGDLDEIMTEFDNI